MGHRTRVGEYKHMVVFQEKQIVSDGMGQGGSEMWVDSSLIELAAIWPLKAKEVIIGMKEEHHITHRIRIRYHSGVKPTMRIKRILDGKLFDIGSMINPDEADLELEMLAKEVTV